MSVRLARVLVLTTVMAVAACGGGTGGTSEKIGVSKIEVNVEIAPDQFSQTKLVDVDPGLVSVGATRDFNIQVTNRGEQGRALCIESLGIELKYVPPEEEASDPDGPAFRVIAADPIPCIAPTGEGDKMGLPESFTFQVRYKRYADPTAREAVLTIKNDNSTSAESRNYQIRFKTGVCEPSLDVPTTKDLGAVNEPVDESLDVANAGSCPLEITKFLFDGDPNFVLVANGQEYPIEETKGEQVFDPPIVVDPNSPVDPEWRIIYKPATGDPAEARVVIFSNDPAAQDGRVIKIIANSSGPRIKIEPSPVEFGGKLINKEARIDVTITSVGTSALEITDIALRNEAGDSLEFGLLFDKMDGKRNVVLQVNESATFTVSYTPTDKNQVDPATGNVILDVNAINIVSNIFNPKPLGVSGFGVEVECPQPIIVVQEGEEVPPQTVLHLYGDQSQPSTGSITQYEWSVQQPPDNKFNLVPASNFPNPTHEVNIGGEYTYCLDVCDSARCSNDPACHTTACKKVVVIPTQAIHCELTWDTPGDMDQSDEGPDAGSDMDLHFTHPFATGPDLDGDGKPDGWFDIPYDVFWFNPLPDWESMNPNAKDDPRLDRDDTDGAGPENLNLDAPVNNRTYKVGVHYWDDHGYGFSYPHVRCYIWGQLVFDRDLKTMDQKLFKCDMWEVAEILWPSGAVKAVANPDGSLKITHKYINPTFVQIGGGSCTNE